MYPMLAQVASVADHADDDQHRHRERVGAQQPAQRDILRGPDTHAERDPAGQHRDGRQHRQRRGPTTPSDNEIHGLTRQSARGWRAMQQCGHQSRSSCRRSRSAPPKARRSRPVRTPITMHREQHVQRRAELDDQRHTGGQQERGRGDPVVQHQESRGLRHRVTPRHHHEQRDEHHRERGRDRVGRRVRFQARPAGG